MKPGQTLTQQEIFFTFNNYFNIYLYFIILKLLKWKIKESQ
jgi:hypothetical protein